MYYNSVIEITELKDKRLKLLLYRNINNLLFK